jgi:hypothetical protein
MSLVNPNTWHLICNNFNLNFIFGTVCLCVCVCAFSLHRESPDMILGDKPLISEVVLSQSGNGLLTWPMATQRWPDWPVPAGVHGVVTVAGVSMVEQAARAHRWLPCSAVGGVSTRTVRGGRRARRMMTRLTKGVGRRRGGGWGNTATFLRGRQRSRGGGAR